ncbi:MAG: tetratricopeptide repeat protein [Bdellovibrio sp.]|nr:tetratricopeptide repeat protein [Bdellovibrio sp.]
MKINRLLFFIFTLLVDGVLAAETQNARWQQLYQLVNEEIKTIETLGGNRGPDLEYRLFHLHSERLGLIKEEENATFLNARMEERSKRSKESYFTESLKIYQQVKSFGLKIIQDRMAESYFRKALQYVSPASQLAHSIRVGLAEYYYNEKDFKKATLIYRDVVKNEKDEWLAKHYYNLAWCHLKTKNYDTAINNLIIAFNLGKSKTGSGLSYISVSDQVLTAMTVFYVMANRGLEGVQFLIKEVADSTTYLLKLAHSAADHGQFPEAWSALREALKKERDPAKLAQIRLKELDVYRSFKKEDLFFESAKAFCSLQKSALLPIELKDGYVEKTKSLAGQYQMELSKHFHHDKKINEIQLARVLEYFKMIAEVSPKDASAYTYYSGETLFVLKRFGRSAQYYEKAVQLQSETAPDLELLKKILNSFFAAISEDSFPKKEWRRMAYLGYAKMLAFYPKEEKAPWAYRELFALYVEDKRVSEAEKLLNSYQLNFPKDLDIHKKQFLSILDHYIKLKNVTEINRLIALMTKPPFSFALDETEKAKGILGNILFDQFIVLEKQNKLEQATNGLNHLAGQETFPTIVRAKAAYNASLIYLNKMEGEEASQSAMTSLTLMPQKEYSNYLPKFQKMAFLFAYGQFFTQALQLGEGILKITSKNPDHKNLLQEMTLGMIEWNMALRHFQAAETLATNEYSEKANMLILNTYRYLNYRQEYLQFVKKLGQHRHLSSMKQKGEILDYVLNMYIEVFPEKSALGTMAFMVLEESLVSLTSSPETVAHYRQALTQHTQFEKLYAELKTPWKLELEQYLSPFNQDSFNRHLSEGLGKLKELTNKIEDFLKNNNPYYAPYLTYHLGMIYSISAVKIASLNPGSAPVEFQQVFQKEMKNLSRKIEEKGQSYFKSFKKLRTAQFFSGNLNNAVEHSRAPASPMPELTVLMD